jgi:electron transfer flavoprotein alpha subunit
MKSRTVVIAEQAEGKPKPITYELVSCARAIASIDQSNVVLVATGDRADDAANILSETTGLPVTAVRAARAGGSEGYTGEVHLNVLSQMLEELEPSHVCVAHTPFGLDFAPALSVRLGASCVTAVEKISPEGGRVMFTRTVHGGKFVSTVSSRTRCTVLTVQPGAFEADPARPDSPGTVDGRSFETGGSRTRSMGQRQVGETHTALEQAEVIVSAGRGMGKPENLDLLRTLAGLFPRSAVGGSRLAVDMGWLSHSAQVGLTGATVNPRLYFACGISGAPQHLAGMRGAGFVVAVNTDPHAAIFNVADVSVVEDAVAFAQTFVEEYLKST